MEIGMTFRSCHPLSHTLPPQRVDTLISTFQPSKHCISLAALPRSQPLQTFITCILFYGNDGVTGYSLGMEHDERCHYGEIRKVGEGCRISRIDHLRRTELAIRGTGYFPRYPDWT